MFALCLGYIMIAFTEPLAIISYVLRAFRLRRIYDAQVKYFKEDRKPTELFEKFKEHRLITVTAIAVGTLTITYCIVAICLIFVPDDKSKLYLLPSVDTDSFAFGTANYNAEEGQDNFRRGMSISLYFLIIYSFVEGIVFLSAMHRIRNFNEEFNILDEIKRYSIFWLFFTNLILWLLVQGSYA